MTRYIGLIALLGCGVSPPAPSQDDGDTSTVTGVPLPTPSPGNSNPSGGIFAGCGTHCDDIEPQGPYMLGSSLDGPPYTKSGDTYYFHVTDAYKGSSHFHLNVVNTAALVAPGHPPGDPFFDGVIITNGTASLKLSPPSGNADMTTFTLFAKGINGLYTVPVCNNAIPISGRYKRDGTREADSTYLTFACDDGDAEKCTYWGYPGGLPALHQTCTRAARDDIWGTGRSHTHLDTWIGLHDVGSIRGYPTDDELHVVPQTYPPDPTRMFFEVAFSPNGAVCLGRARWRSLKPNPFPDLPDPRTDPNGRACEDQTVDQLVAKGAMIFVWSYYNDAALLRWHAAPPDVDYVTTVYGYYSTTTGVQAPVADGRTYLFDTVDGYLMRAIPASIQHPDTELNIVAMYRETSTNHLVLARVVDNRLDPTKYELLPDAEGYVFNDSRDGTVQLRMYYNAATDDFLSTTDANSVPGGYAWAGDIGWIFPVDQQ